MTEELCSDLDRYIDHARSMNLTPHQMLDLQTQIAGVRYTLSHKMAEAERAMLSAKDRRDLHLVRETLKLQAMDKKLSTARAQDQVNDTVAMELIHQYVISTKIDHASIKGRLDTSSDMLVSLAQRIKRAEQEQIESRMQTRHA